MVEEEEHTRLLRIQRQAEQGQPTVRERAVADEIYAPVVAAIEETMAALKDIHDKEEDHG